MTAGGAIGIAPLNTALHNRDGFTCGNAVLDAYLRTQAGQDLRRRVAAVFVATARVDDRTVLGYYTLAQASVSLDAIPVPLRKRLPRYPYVPVTLLGRLAVSLSAQGRGLGAQLLGDALRRSLAAASEVASAGVIVQPIDDAAAEFYAHFGFAELGEAPRCQFIPMQTVHDAVR
jgi:GNAT superfamily N-acetyltransferase